MNVVKQLLPAIQKMQKRVRAHEAPPVTKTMDPAVRKERMDICRSCEFSREIRMDVLQCTKCGCVCQFKTMFKNTTCPINKW